MPAGRSWVPPDRHLGEATLEEHRASRRAGEVSHSTDAVATSLSLTARLS
jgi:hypothetical protein